eukprot:g4810.t1
MRGHVPRLEDLATMQCKCAKSIVGVEATADDSYCRVKEAATKAGAHCSGPYTSEAYTPVWRHLFRQVAGTYRSPRNWIRYVPSSSHWMDVSSFSSSEFNYNFVAVGGMMKRVCSKCANSHKTIVYKRTSPMPSGKDWNDLFKKNWFSENNQLNVDFELYSSVADATKGVNKWKFCNYDDPGVGFPRDCGPKVRINSNHYPFKPAKWYMPNPNFSKLDELEGCRGYDGKLHMKLVWPQKRGVNTQEWKQITNPVLDGTKKSPSGYEGVEINFNGNYWKGLEYNGKYSLLDGSTDHSNWWYAVGSNAHYYTKIPGPSPGVKVGEVELYAMCPLLQKVKITNGRMSSLHSQFYPASNCYDGNKNNFCHTIDNKKWTNAKLREGAWLQLDFEDALITSIKITNRQNCCWERLGIQRIQRDKL